MGEVAATILSRSAVPLLYYLVAGKQRARVVLGYAFPEQVWTAYFERPGLISRAPSRAAVGTTGAAGVAPMASAPAEIDGPVTFGDPAPPTGIYVGSDPNRIHVLWGKGSAYAWIGQQGIAKLFVIGKEQ